MCRQCDGPSCEYDGFNMFRVNSKTRYCEGCYMRIEVYSNILGKSVIYLTDKEIAKSFTIPLTKKGKMAAEPGAMGFHSSAGIVGL